MTCIPCMIAFLGDFRYLPSGLRRINLKPIMRLDQLRRKICELIRMGCDEQSTDPKKNETTSEIIFTPMKPPDFDKKDVKIVNLPPVFSRPAGENFIYSCIMFFLLTSWVKNIILAKESGCPRSTLDNTLAFLRCDQSSSNSIPVVYNDCMLTKGYSAGPLGKGHGFPPGILASFHINDLQCATCKIPANWRRVSNMFNLVVVEI